jgi:hypothetical protein
MSTQMVATPGIRTATSVAPVIEMAQIVIEERDAELAILRERLAYYEAFDSLINDNVARSAELFRSVSDERERLRAEAAQHQLAVEDAAEQEVERRIAAERQRTQAMLMSLMDEASRMQRQIDGLIQRIAQAITESAVRLPESAGQSAPGQPAR